MRTLSSGHVPIDLLKLFLSNNKQKDLNISPLLKTIMFITDWLWKGKFKPYLPRVEKLKEDFKLQRLLIGDTFMGGCSATDALEDLRKRYLRTPERALFGITAAAEKELAELGKSLKEGSVAETADFLDILIQDRAQYEFYEGEKKHPDSLTIFSSLHHTLAHKYENGAVEIIGTPLQDLILSYLIDRECAFTKKCVKHDYEEVGDSVKEEFRKYSSMMRRVYQFDFEQAIGDYVSLLEDLKTLLVGNGRGNGLGIDFTREVPSISSYKPVPPRSRISISEERRILHQKKEIKLKKAIADEEDWDNIDKLIADHYRESKLSADSTLFTMGVNPMSGEIALTPKTIRKKVTFEDLVGYDEEKGRLRQNTESLLAGNDANNVFMYGPPGTGKSSMVNALLNEYSDQNLRVIEIPKQAAPFLAALFDEIEAQDEYKFIVLIDEFKVGEDEAFYDALKTVIEGSFDGMPDNARLCVISNDQDCMKSVGFNREEKNASKYKALEDRFGLSIKFHMPDEEEQEAIMKKYLNGQAETHADLMCELKSYCVSREITHPNPRNIRDFVKTLN